MNLIQIFGDNVKFYRIKKEMSQSDLGKLTGLSRVYISNIETYKRNISIGNIEKIANALKIESYKLFMERK